MPRADWHHDVHVDESDPFAGPAPSMHRIDLSNPDILQAQLIELMLAEGRLHERGITCAIKDRPDTCCSACPLRGSTRAKPIRELCNVGREQELTMMTQVAISSV